MSIQTVLLSFRHRLVIFFSRPENLFLAAILALAALLRFKGIHWGIPTPNIPHALFHPDEEWSMGVLREIDVSSFSLNPVSAHREGTLSYYVFLFTSTLLRLTAQIPAFPNNVELYSPDYALILLSGRIAVVFFDLASVWLIYRILKNLSDSKLVPVLGAFIFAIMPFGVIHAHYMRSHNIANFFILLVLYFCSWKMQQQFMRRRYGEIGFAAGLATATKYNAVLILLVPLWSMASGLLRNFRPSYSGVSHIFRKIKNDPKIRMLVKFFFIGLFIADPFLFLRFDRALESLSVQASFAATEEFSLKMLFDLSRVWIYVKYLIPYGNLPYLWILLYGSITYLVFAKRLYPKTLPLLFFLLVFVYLMSKGYAVPVYIRASLMLFPVMAILSAIAIGDILQRLSSVYLKILCFTGLGFFGLTTVAFDWAYVSAMSRPDPRIRLFEYFRDNRPQNEAHSIAVLKSPVMNSFLISPTLDVLAKSGTVSYEPVGDEKALAKSDADYVLLFAFDPGDDTGTDSLVKRLESGKRFRLVRKFENPVTLWGFTFASVNFPHDLSYPFPRFSLLKNTAAD